MTFLNKYLQKIYKYIYCHDGQNILIKDIIAETGFSENTVAKYIRWLEKRGLLQRDGKKFFLKPE